jgi:hypothetical protein
MLCAIGLAIRSTCAIAIALGFSGQVLELLALRESAHACGGA